MKHFTKYLLLIFFSLTCQLVLLAQPSTDYYLKAGGPNLVIYSKVSDGSDCIQNCHCQNCSGGPSCDNVEVKYYEYGFVPISPTGSSAWPVNNLPGSNARAYTLTPLSPGANRIISYRERWAGYFFDGFNCRYVPDGSNEFELYRVTVYTEPELVQNNSFPTTICQNSGVLNLYNYINHSSSIIFKDGPTTITSTFNPATVSLGNHTITATRNFDNGPTTLTLGTIQVLQPGSITSHPSNVSVCPASGATFTASGAGSSIVYQWQESTNGGSSWNNLSNAGVYTGVTTGTLSIGNVSGRNGYYYRLQISGPCNTIYTNPASLTHFGQVAVTSAPINQSTCPGGSATFSVSGTPRNGSLLYQWQKSSDGGATWSNWTDGTFSGVVYSGGTTATASISNAIPILNDNRFRCVLSDACGSINQNVTTSGILTVYSSIPISTHPQNISICQGSATNFTVSGTAQNGTLNYKWQHSTNGGSTWSDLANGGVFSGVTTSTLSLSSSVDISYNNRRVRCILFDGCGTATQSISNAAILTVYGPVSISAHPANQNVCPTGTSTFSVAAASGNGGSLAYQWQYNSGTWTNLSNGAMTGGTVSGANTSTLSISNISSPLSGKLVRVVVSDGCGVVNQAISNNATINVYGQVIISSQPPGRTICPGSNTSFSISATPSNGSVLYQWQVSTNNGSSYADLTNTGIYSGVTTSTLVLTGAPIGVKNYLFRAKVSDACGSLTANTSNAGILNMYDPVSISTQPSNRTICPNSNTSFSITATASNGSLGYKWQVSTDGGSTYTNLTDTGIYSGSSTGTLSLTNAPVGNNNFKYRCIVNDACGSVNQSVSNAGTLTFNSPITISSQPVSTVTGCSSGNATLSVLATGTGITYQWQESSNSGSTWTNLTNTGIYTGTTLSTLTFTGIPPGFNGYKYRVVINGTCNTVTSNLSTLTVTVPPSIVTDPVSLTVCENTAANFSVTASGSSLSYQWQFSPTGGAGTFANITSGASASNFSISITSPSQAGYYRVLVNNGCAGGGTPSGSAQLTVNPITSIVQQPTNKSVCPLGSTSFAVTASGTPALSYQWQVSSGSVYSDISNSGIYSGATGTTLTINGATQSLDDFTYRVKVTGSCGPSVTSNSGTLSVNPIPSSPVVANPSRCGDGMIEASATSTFPSPVFKWYTNLNDVTPVFTGTTYSINNLTVSRSMFVSVTSLSCESQKREVIFTRNSPQNVPLGDALTLCVGQGIYNLANDISSEVAVGSDFTWTANGTNYISKNFNPSVGTGNYVVTYDPPSTAKFPPHCFIQTTRNITVVSSGGEGGIQFTNSLISNGNTINSCVGDNPIDIAGFPSTGGGSWSTVSGTGLSFSGAAVVFTANQNSYTAVNPNVFRYTVVENGCTSSKDLNIYVKDNQNPPIVSGIPSVVCPGTILSLAASVSSPGTFTYQWFKAGQNIPFASNGNVDFTVSTSETIEVRSINSSFGCLSEATQKQIITPFSSGSISANKSLINVGDNVKFTTDASSSGNTFNWNFGDGFTSVEKDPNHYFYSVGEFVPKLVITSALGCSQTLHFNKIIVTGTPPDDIITGIPTHLEGVHVFPNPVTDFFEIQSESPIEKIIVVNALGVFKTTLVSENKHHFRIDLSSYANGFYILILQGKTSQHAVRLFKQ